MLHTAEFCDRLAVALLGLELRGEALRGPALLGVVLGA
jgi:hypothetical protein